jgi:hypothetical protein
MPLKQNPAGGGLTVIIPTRNRGRLACAAVASVTGDAAEGIRVIVSDNSSSAEERRNIETFCAGQDPAVVRYVRPAEALSMTAHWSWALQAALQMTPATHFAVLTDRMIFKPGHLQEIWERAQRYPGDVVSFNYDMVEDSTTPVSIELQPWTGNLVELDATHLLALAAHGIFSNALPRMLNCVAPRTVLASIAGRFGSVFASVSPDVCFMFRCLAVMDRVLFYDKAALIQYAVGRSQGINFARGIVAPEVTDFAALQGGTSLNLSAAPIPEIQTMTNSVFHEYGFVKAAANSEKFQEIDRPSYLGAIAWDAQVLRNPARAAAVRRSLRQHGWTAADTARWFVRKVALTLLHNPGLALDGLQTRLSVKRFPNAEEGIAYAATHPRRRRSSLAHLWQLLPRIVEGPGARQKEPPQGTVEASVPPLRRSA